MCNKLTLICIVFYFELKLTCVRLHCQQATLQVLLLAIMGVFKGNVPLERRTKKSPKLLLLIIKIIIKLTLVPLLSYERHFFFENMYVGISSFYICLAPSKPDYAKCNLFEKCSAWKNLTLIQIKSKPDVFTENFWAFTVIYQNQSFFVWFPETEN